MRDSTITTGPWISDEELLAKLKDILQKAKIEEQSPWESIVQDSNRAAYMDIVTALADRGFSRDQIDAWEAGEVYNIDLGLFWCLVRGGCTKLFDPVFIQELDRREELKTVAVMIDGEVVGTMGSSAVQSGHMEGPDDVFRRPRPWPWSSYPVRWGDCFRFR